MSTATVPWIRMQGAGKEEGTVWRRGWEREGVKEGGREGSRKRKSGRNKGNITIKIM